MPHVKNKVIEAVSGSFMKAQMICPKHGREEPAYNCADVDVKEAHCCEDGECTLMEEEI